MNSAYVIARIPQIDRMLRRDMVNPLSGRYLGVKGALFALRRNNEINDEIERLTDERKTLEGL